MTSTLLLPLSTFVKRSAALPTSRVTFTPFASSKGLIISLSTISWFKPKVDTKSSPEASFFSAASSPLLLSAFAVLSSFFSPDKFAWLFPQADSPSKLKLSSVAVITRNGFFIFPSFNGFPTQSLLPSENRDSALSRFPSSLHH